MGTLAWPGRGVEAGRLGVGAAVQHRSAVGVKRFDSCLRRRRAAPRKPPPTAAPPLPSFTPPRRAGQTQAGDLSDSDDISVASLLSEEDSEGALVDAARARRGASRGGDGVSRHPMLKRPRRGEGRGDLENTVRLLRDNLDRCGGAGRRLWCAWSRVMRCMGLGLEVAVGEDMLQHGRVGTC